MADKIAFYQIYYKEEQLSELYNFSIPYYNPNLTDYFENSVIRDIVPKTDAERICVASWRLSQKRGNGIRVKKQLTTEALIDDYDIAILTPRSPNHKALSMASIWHGKAWDEAIKDLRKNIRVPSEVKYAIYENHFIAKGDIYKEYVSNCLSPVMDYMVSNPVYFADSGYIKKKSQEEVKAYQEKTGRRDWPIAPFVLERLFSIWINDKNFKVVNK